MSDPPNKILLVDDENIPTNYYARALEREGFLVRRARGVSEALEAVEGLEFDAVVADIMMAPGELYKDENHDEGLKTGVFLIRDLAMLRPGMAVVVLTNVTNQETLRMVAKVMSGVIIAAKIDYPPLEFAALVRKTLSARDSRENHG